MAVIDWHWQAEALSGHCGGGAVFGEGGKAEPQRCNSEANCEKGGRIDVISTLYEVSVNLVHAFSANEQTDID
jgi:hypothetical protein